MSRRIEDLAPYFQDAARAFWNDVVTRGPRCMLYSTARTTAEQVAMYAQGREPLDRVNAKRLLADMPPIVEYVGKNGKVRSDNDYTITNADGIKIKSAHQSLEAMDIVVLTEAGRPTWDYKRYADEYRLLRDIGREHGLECGADWAPIDTETGLGWDPPHFQRRNA